MRDKAIRMYAGAQARLTAAARSERGDLVGWLLIAVMTAALVAVVWQFLGKELRDMIREAIGQAQDEVPG